MNLDSLSLEDQENGSTSLSDVDSRLLIIEKEEFLHPANGRMICIDEVFQIFRYIKEL